MICEVEGWACSLSANSLDRFANESAEDFMVASKPVMESSSFLLLPSCCKTEISSSLKAWLVVAS